MFYSCFLSVPPSYGDIVVDKESNNLYISLAPDNMENEKYMYYVCGSRVRNDVFQKFAMVISRQLGYRTCSVSPEK